MPLDFYDWFKDKGCRPQTLNDYNQNFMFIDDTQIYI